MSKLCYPNESAEYRKAREALHKDEQDLIDKVRPWRRSAACCRLAGA